MLQMLLLLCEARCVPPFGVLISFFAAATKRVV